MPLPFSCAFVFGFVCRCRYMCVGMFKCVAYSTVSVCVHPVSLEWSTEGNLKYSCLDIDHPRFFETVILT